MYVIQSSKDSLVLSTSKHTDCQQYLRDNLSAKQNIVLFNVIMLLFNMLITEKLEFLFLYSFSLEIYQLKMNIVTESKAMKYKP